MIDGARFAPVTGGSRGAISLALARAGVRVEVNDRRRADAAVSSDQTLNVDGGWALY